MKHLKGLARYVWAYNALIFRGPTTQTLSHHFLLETNDEFQSAKQIKEKSQLVPIFTHLSSKTHRPEMVDVSVKPVRPKQHILALAALHAQQVLHLTSFPLDHHSYRHRAGYREDHRSAEGPVARQKLHVTGTT